jgi:hypothetical protein
MTMSMPMSMPMSMLIMIIIIMIMTIMPIMMIMIRLLFYAVVLRGSFYYVARNIAVRSTMSREILGYSRLKVKIPGWVGNTDRDRNHGFRSVAQNEGFSKDCLLM